MLEKSLRLRHTPLKGVFHSAENRQRPSRFFFGKWAELMNIYVARVLRIT